MMVVRMGLGSPKLGVGVWSLGFGVGVWGLGFGVWGLLAKCCVRKVQVIERRRCDGDVVKAA